MSVINNAICGFIEDYEDEETDESPFVEPNDEDEIGCCFPAKCCMPGLHMRSECHTAEMLESMYPAE